MQGTPGGVGGGTWVGPTPSCPSPHHAHSEPVSLCYMSSHDVAGPGELDDVLHVVCHPHVARVYPWFCYMASHDETGIVHLALRLGRRVRRAAGAGGGALAARRRGGRGLTALKPEPKALSPN